MNCGVTWRFHAGVLVHVSDFSNLWGTQCPDLRCSNNFSDSFFFFRPENKLVLSVLSVVSLCITVLIRSREIPRSSTLLLSAGCAAVYCFRAANGAVTLPLVYDSSTVLKGITEARLVYGIVVLLLVNAGITCLRMRGSYKSRQGVGTTQLESALCVMVREIQTVWILLMLLLLRPHNLPLVMVIVLQELCVRSYVERTRRSFSTATLTLLFLWMGQAAFFYQVRLETKHGNLFVSAPAHHDVHVAFCLVGENVILALCLNFCSVMWTFGPKLFLTWP